MSIPELEILGLGSILLCPNTLQIQNFIIITYTYNAYLYFIRNFTEKNIIRSILPHNNNWQILYNIKENVYLNIKRTVKKIILYKMLTDILPEFIYLKTQFYHFFKQIILHKIFFIKIYLWNTCIFLTLLFSFWTKQC